MDQSRGRKVGDQARERQDQTGDRADDLSEKVSKVGADAQSKMSEAAGPVKDQIEDFAEQQKSAGADQVSELGRAVHGAAEQLGKELPQAAGYIHAAADKLEGASSALRDRSVEELMDTFNQFARSQPAAAFAGSVLAGFALSRFLKSSKPTAGYRS
jgi:hypothetical protein